MPSYRDNGDGTITDLTTGLIWQKTPDFEKHTQDGAEDYAQGLKLAGSSDWRLPNVKELQSIVDYSRAPDASKRSQQGPAIDPIFGLTEAESWFWSSTTHIENQFAYSVCFGQSFSTRTQAGKQINAHGAGAVRTGPKDLGGESKHAHASLEEVAHMAAKSKVGTLVLTHFRPGAIDEAATLERMSAIYKGEIVFASDMQVHR